MCNYNISSITPYAANDNGFKWEDSEGNGNTLISSGNTTFDGSCIVSTNAIWKVPTVNTIVTSNVPDTFTALVMVSITSGMPALVVNGDKTNQYSISAENIQLRTDTTLVMYQNASPAKTVTLPSSMHGQKIVIGETYNANREVVAVLITEDGTLYKTDAITSLYTDDDPIANLHFFGMNRGFVGNAYQALLFDTVLDDTTLKSVAAQMFEKNA